MINTIKEKDIKTIKEFNKFVVKQRIFNTQILNNKFNLIAKIIVKNDMTFNRIDNIYNMIDCTLKGRTGYLFKAFKLSRIDAHENIIKNNQTYYNSATKQIVIKKKAIDNHLDAFKLELINGRWYYRNFSRGYLQ